MHLAMPVCYTSCVFPASQPPGLPGPIRVDVHRVWGGQQERLPQLRLRPAVYPCGGRPQLLRHVSQHAVQVR